MPTPKEIATELFREFLLFEYSINGKTFANKIYELTEKGIPKDIAERELVLFCDYWTEPTASGKKQRWETEKTFELDRRIRRWFMNKKFTPVQSLTQLPGINL